MYTPSTRFAGILALLLVFVVSGCSEDSMLVGPEASQKMSQTETLAIAPSNGVSAFSLGKGGDTVAVCHVPNGNDAHDAIYMEVGANAAMAHLNNHAGDRQIDLGGSCAGTSATEWLLWLNTYAQAYGRQVPGTGFLLNTCDQSIEVIWGSNGAISVNGTSIPLIDSAPAFTSLSAYLADNFMVCDSYSISAIYQQYQDATVEDEGEWVDDGDEN